MSRFKILNLYAGIGGNRNLWGDDHDVTAVEINKQVAEYYSELHPKDKVIVSDAHQYLLDHYQEFDFIWSSPPCPSHSRMMKFTRHDVAKYPDMSLYQEIIFLQNFFDGKWVVENVIPYYKPLIPAREIARHLFWSNFRIGNIAIEEFKGDYLKSYKGELEKYYGIKLPVKNIYFDGSHDQYKILKNCVHPKIGLHILETALGIIRKSNVKQTSIFDVQD